MRRKRWQSLWDDGSECRTNLARSSGAIYRLSIPSAAGPLMRAPIPASDGLQWSWTSLPGRSYQLQFKSTLDQSAWADSGGSITSTGTVVTAIDQAAAGSAGSIAL